MKAGGACDKPVTTCEHTVHESKRNSEQASQGKATRGQVKTVAMSWRCLFASPLMEAQVSSFALPGPKNSSNVLVDFSHRPRWMRVTKPGAVAALDPDKKRFFVQPFARGVSAKAHPCWPSAQMLLTCTMSSEGIVTPAAFMRRWNSLIKPAFALAPLTLGPAT